MGKKIDSEIKNLGAIFEGSHIFKIPEFQRDFVWGSNEVKVMLEDFSEDSDNFQDVNNNEGYLLGNIVLIETPKEDGVQKEVIDGQQRLTVLSVIFHVLENYINSVVIPNNNKKVSDLYDQKKISVEARDKEYKQVNKKCYHATAGLSNAYTIGESDEIIKNKDMKIVHAPSLMITQSYKDFIQGEKNSTEDERIEEIALAVNDYLEALSQEYPEDEYNAILNFSKYLKEKVNIIETIAPSLSKAYQLFEVLNQRGKGLEPLDLIKNVLLKQLIKDENWENKNEVIFQQKWREMTDHLTYPKGPKKGSIQSSTFLKHYILGTEGKNVGKSKLFKYFMDMNVTANETMKLVEDLNRVAIKYSSIQSNDFQNVFSDKFTNQNYLQRLLKIIFELLNARQIHSLLIPFYNANQQDSERVLKKAVQLATTFNYSGSSPNEIERLLPTHLKTYLDLIKNDNSDKSKEMAMALLLKGLTEGIKTKQHLLKETVKEKKFETKGGKYNNKSLHLYQIMETLELNDVSLSEDKNAKVSLDHISPRTLPNAKTARDIGFKNEAERLEYLNRIGNLCLIIGTHNSSMGNKLFVDKLAHYKESRYWTTSILVNEKNTPVGSGDEKERVINFNKHMYSPDLIKTKQWAAKEIRKRSKNVAEYLSYLLSK